MDLRTRELLQDILFLLSFSVITREDKIKFIARIERLLKESE
jgi:hypothetical protein